MGIVYRPLELPSREGELKTFPTKREVGKSSSSTVPAMGSMICDRSQKGNAKFTSKMERLPILREDDKVVWNWWCVVWFIGHCHGNKNYQFFRSRSTLCFIFQTISLNITSVPWLEHKKNGSVSRKTEQCGQGVYADTTYDSLSMDSTRSIFGALKIPRNVSYS